MTKVDIGTSFFPISSLDYASAPRSENLVYSMLLAFITVFNQCLIDVLLPGVLQDVEETQVDSVRLFHDDVQQRLSGFDWTISQRLN